MKSSIVCVCPLCGQVSIIECETSQMVAYENGALAQDAFSDMDIQTRETIISGMCADCQATFFIDEDDCDGDCDFCTDPDCPGSALN